MTNLHWFLGCFGGGCLNSLLSESDFSTAFAPVWGKLELNQKHLEFYFCAFSFISVTFGVSEQAARAVQFLVQLRVDLQVLVHSCSVDARLCCTQSLLQLQTQAGRQQSASNLGNTAFDLQLFMACLSQAVLLFQTAQDLCQKQELRKIPFLQVQLTWILRSKHFQKALFVFGEMFQNHVQNLSSDI